MPKRKTPRKRAPRPGEGRPTDYKPEYCEQLIRHMSKGFPYETFAGEIGVCRKTIYNWEEDHPEFLYAKNIGKEQSYAALMKLGMGGMTGQFKNFNATVWIFMMKNMCGWRDKQDVTVKTRTFHIKGKDGKILASMGILGS